MTGLWKSPGGGVSSEWGSPWSFLGGLPLFLTDSSLTGSQRLYPQVGPGTGALPMRPALAAHCPTHFQQVVKVGMSQDESELGLDVASSPMEEPHNMESQRSGEQRYGAGRATGWWDTQAGSGLWGMKTVPPALPVLSVRSLLSPSCCPSSCPGPAVHPQPTPVPS